MPISISPVVPSININGNTYSHTDWENNTPGTISGIANDISARQILLELVGILTKTISGNTTLTGPESTNIGFVFTGALSIPSALVTFAAGFEGLAQIENQTTGGFEISCGLATGTRVIVPSLGSAAVFCDGINFTLASGVMRTSAGSRVTGTLSVGGASVFTGAAQIVGAATLSSTLYVTGNTSIAGSGSITGNLTVGGEETVQGLLTIEEGLNITANAADDIFINLSAEDGEAIWINYSTEGFGRWLVGKSDTLESGANVGSDFHIVRLNDGGAAVAIPFKIKRNNGNIILEELPTSASGLGAGTVWNDSGTLKIV